jgi:hypothetical protein
MLALFNYSQKYLKLMVLNSKSEYQNPKLFYLGNLNFENLCLFSISCFKFRFGLPFRI